jgi:hypothetical protein
MAWYIDSNGMATTSDILESVPTTPVITGLISPSSVVCCPGLLDILQASTAPTLSQLKSLPADFHKRWAIYLLVLEKPFCVPTIYIGSGTGVQSGISHRMSCYDNLIVCQGTLRKLSRTGIPLHIRVYCSGHLFPQQKRYHSYELCSLSSRPPFALSSGQSCVPKSAFPIPLAYLHYVHGLSKTSPILVSVPTTL